MPLDLPKLRKLVWLDVSDPLSRFALGKKLFEEAGDDAMLSEAAEHLRFAELRGSGSPCHLPRPGVMLPPGWKLNDEGRQVLIAGIEKSAKFHAHGMGRDLGPLMQTMLSSLK